ncbi:hypothetical protein KPL78_29810 [Roseomonas sp. HJA6]|uniref:DUF1834 family protein n=1 Tax=Roseomonas alba TaxID=2846776 RepID=A0ABS7AL49_9PROT|nr:hypothetical protein [Neoroseomonas alba]MBW6402080.1 hypothetical protein [Neoroseomonas alba]
MAVQDLIAAGPLLDCCNALQARLKAFFPPAQFTHQVVPAKLTPTVWASLTRVTPMIGLGWGGVRPKRDNAHIFAGDALWTVFLVTKNSNSPVARLLGDAMGAGQLGVAQIAAVALQGFMIAGIGTATVTDVGNVSAENLAEENTAITAINVEVPLSLSIAGDGDLTEFLRMHVQWQFPDAEGPADMIEVRD